MLKAMMMMIMLQATTMMMMLMIMLKAMTIAMLINMTITTDMNCQSRALITFPGRASPL